MNQPQTTDSQDLLLQNLLLTLWRKKLLIVLTTVLALGAALLLAEEPPAPPPVYQATATMVIDLGALGSGDPVIDNALTETVGDRGVQTHIRLMTSKNVMDRAAAKVLEGDENVTPSEIEAESAALQSGVTINPVRDTNLLEIRVQGSSPSHAEGRANAVIDAYIEYVKTARTQAIEDALESIRNRIRTANGDEPSSVASALLARLAPELESVGNAVSIAGEELHALEIASQEQLGQDPSNSESAPAVDRTSVNSVVSTLNRSSKELQFVSEQIIGVENRFRASVPTNTTTSDTVALLRSSAALAETAAEKMSDAATLLTSESPLQAQTVESVDSALLDTWHTVDTLTRQLTAVVARVADIPLSSEIAALGGLASANRNDLQNAWGQVATLLEQLNDVEGGEGQTGGSEAEPSEHVLGLRNAQDLLSAVIRSLDGVATLTETNDAGQATPIRFSALEDSAARLGAATRNLEQATTVIAGLQATASGVDESTQLLVTVERIRNTTGRLSALVQQLTQGVSRPDGIDRQELLRQEQRLELALLQPQETGLAIVDSAESRRINSSTTSSLGVDMRVIAAAVGGLMVGVIGALALEFVDRRVRTPERLRTSTGLATLGQLPKVRHAPASPLPSPGDPRSAMFDMAMRLTADKVLSAIPQERTATLITSALRGEGKTTVALNLARLSARAGFKTLLVDADFTKQDAGHRLAITSAVGVSSCLRGLTTPENYVTSIEADCDFLPSGDTTGDPLSLMSSPAMTRLLHWANETYDRVFIDAPSLVGHADTILLARQVGSVLMVVHGPKTMLGDVQRAKDAAQDVAALVLGCVINFVPPKTVGLKEETKDQRKRWLRLPMAPGLMRREKGAPEGSQRSDPANVSGLATATKARTSTLDAEEGKNPRAANHSNGNGHHRSDYR